MSRRLSTGIDVLNRQLDGGIPTGSIVLFSADPASQSELLLYEVTAVRMALYLTTIRSDQAVQDALDRTSRYTNVGDCFVEIVAVVQPVNDVVGGHFTRRRHEVVAGEVAHIGFGKNVRDRVDDTVGRVETALSTARLEGWCVALRGKASH